MSCFSPVAQHASVVLQLLLQCPDSEPIQKFVGRNAASAEDARNPNYVHDIVYCSTFSIQPGIAGQSMPRCDGVCYAY
jgi:hypothetical protein